MDNTAPSVGCPQGEKLKRGGHQCLLENFSAYTSLELPSLDSVAFEALMAQYRQAEAVLGLALKWPSRLEEANLEPKVANALIKNFVQSLSHPCCYGVDDGRVCSASVAEAHSVMDYATDHPAGGHHWILHWTTEGNCLFLDKVQQQVGVGGLVLMPPDCACRYQRSPSSGRCVYHRLRFVPDPAWQQWCPPLHRRSGNCWPRLHRIRGRV